MLAPLGSNALNQNVPAHLRDNNDKWTALSLRARIIAVSKDRVGKEAITTIEDLASQNGRARFVPGKGSHVYNRALLASIIAHHGEGQQKMDIRSCQ